MVGLPNILTRIKKKQHFYFFKLLNLWQQLIFFSILAPLWPIFLLPLPFFSNCAFCFCFCSGFNPLPAWAGCKTKQKPGHFSQCAVEAPYWKFSLMFVNMLFAPFSPIERLWIWTTTVANSKVVFIVFVSFFEMVVYPVTLWEEIY